MVLTMTLGPELEAALQDRACREGTTPEELALKLLREKLLAATAVPEPRDDWERRLLAIGSDCGVSLSNEALSREELYD